MSERISFAEKIRTYTGFQLLSVAVQNHRNRRSKKPYYNENGNVVHEYDRA